VAPKAKRIYHRENWDSERVRKEEFKLLVPKKPSWGNLDPAQIARVDRALLETTVPILDLSKRFGLHPRVLRSRLTTLGYAVKSIEKWTGEQVRVKLEETK
jgi:hypothetical protein